MFRRYVSLTPSGSYQFEFPEPVRELVVHLADQLDTMLDGDDESLTRLFPTAYNKDPERDAGYQILARDQLIDHRRNSLDVVRATKAATVLTEAELTSWMNVVNDLRLVLGTRLDVSEETDWVPDDDPMAPLFHFYAVLGQVLGEIVDGLSSGLDEPADDGDTSNLGPSDPDGGGLTNDDLE